MAYWPYFIVHSFRKKNPPHFFLHVDSVKEEMNI